MKNSRSVTKSVISDYWMLTKPEINFLILIATFTGFYGGEHRGLQLLLLVHTLLGTLLVASGTATLNQYIERGFDSQMRRTACRPISSGRLDATAALCFGVALSVAGALYLELAVNGLASLLAVFTLVTYLAVYTPLKRKTPLCTLVGAIPGAMPPLIGWAAAAGHLDAGAWILYLILFLWQLPHFMAIAWMYREDYGHAGYLVLPGEDTRVRFVILQTLLPLSGLLLASTVVHWPGAAFLLSLGFLYYGVQFAIRRSGSAARRLLAASIVYLPLLLGVIVLAR